MRGAAFSSQDVHPGDPENRTPLTEKPSAWTAFWHENGLGAIGNASQKIIKLFAAGKAIGALKTLTNAAQVSLHN